MRICLDRCDRADTRELRAQQPERSRYPLKHRVLARASVIPTSISFEVDREDVCRPLEAVERGSTIAEFGDVKGQALRDSAEYANFFGGSPVRLHVYVRDVDAVARQAIAAGAKVVRPVEDRFYGDRNGAFEDPFGHEWHVSTHIEDVSAAELRKRAAAQAGH